MSLRPPARFLAALLLPIALPGCSVAGPLDPGGPPGGSRPLTLDWCGMLELPDSMPDGTALGGLSALAWDAEHERLYMLSDRGRLYHARPRFDAGGELTHLELLDSFALRHRDGSRLEMPMADSESAGTCER
ncbi:esterase-like activity of phytase family protein [Kushneria aurantia]|uniref:Esterase-like activity of phytase family protein n=1 Tax=Kushneria aurantia TaxID=504092 RepID=A0ABV6G7D4_9GAMM|nr:esterase-like activity of phytase family protein [Kushneria aurantia]